MDAHVASDQETLCSKHIEKIAQLDVVRKQVSLTLSLVEARMTFHSFACIEVLQQYPLRQPHWNSNLQSHYNCAASDAACDFIYKQSCDRCEISINPILQKFWGEQVTARAAFLQLQMGSLVGTSILYSTVVVRFWRLDSWLSFLRDKWSRD